MARSALQFILTPSNLFLILTLLGMVFLVIRWRRLGIGFSVLGLGGMLVFGYTSTAEVLMAPLVSRFPAVDATKADPPFGLIVMAGGINEVHATHNNALIELEDGGERVPIAALLARRYPQARLILSGGSSRAQPLREIDGMVRILQSFGVAPERLEVEDRSANTASRARNTLALIGTDQDRDWWLVTSAHKIPRAMGSFRALGFEPIPYPVDFRWIPPFDPSHFYTLPKGLGMTDDAAHEWMGLLFYWMRGRTDSFFPGP